MNESLKGNEFYAKLFTKFDRAVISSLDHFRKQINVSIQKAEKRLKTCEQVIFQHLEKTKRAYTTDLNLAEVLVNKELRSKVIMSQWTNKFLSSTSQDVLDPITFSLSRFSLNISLSFREVTPIYFIETSIHKHLIDYIGLKSELVIGPALLALVHISLYPEIKSHIITCGALGTVLKLLVHHDSKIILAQATKLCASLSLDFSCKIPIAQSGCMHALFDLILGAHQDVDRHIQYNTLCAIVNVTYKNDANRMLAVELNGIKPLLTIMKTTSHEDIIVQSIKALANISFGNGYTANCILIAGGGEVLVEVLETCDILRQPLIAHAILATFSNICSSDVNQSHIGSIKGLVEVTVRICAHARELYLATEAANFLLALCWKNTINKSRVASRDGCTALMARIVKHATVQASEHRDCCEMMCLALSSILLYSSNHERMTVIHGLEDTIKLCKIVSEPILLRALSKIIVTMVPNPADLIRAHEDDNQFPVEKLGALPVLKKAKLKGFGHLPSAPDWLESAIDVLSKTDSDLRETEPLKQLEFVEKLDFCKEFSTNINPDSTVLDSKIFKGLLFSIY